MSNNGVVLAVGGLGLAYALSQTASGQEVVKETFGEDIASAIPSFTEFTERIVEKSSITNIFTIPETLKQSFDDTVSNFTESSYNPWNLIPTLPDLNETSQNLKDTTQSIGNNAVDIAKYIGGGYVGGKVVGFGTKLIPTRKIITNIEKKVVETGTKNAAAQITSSTIGRSAGKVARVGGKAVGVLGAVDVAVNIGSYGGAAIGNATADTSIARKTAQFIVNRPALDKTIRAIAGIGKRLRWFG